MRAPTVGALDEAKNGEKAQFTRVNECFEPVFLMLRVSKRCYRGKWARAKVSLNNLKWFSKNMKKIIVLALTFFFIVGLSGPSWATVESDRHAEIIKAYKSGNEAAAIPKFTRFIADYPDGFFTPSTYMMLAALQVKAKETTKAIESLRTLKTKFPNNPITAQGNILLVNLEKMAGNAVQGGVQAKPAISRQEAYRQRMRDQALWQQTYGQHFKKAEAARLRGDKPEAIRLFKELRDSNPSNRGLIIVAQNRLKILEAKPTIKREVPRAKTAAVYAKANEVPAVKSNQFNIQAKEAKPAEVRTNPLPAIPKAAEKSEKEILALMNTIRKKTDALLVGWKQYQSQKLSSIPRRDYQSDMVDFARDEAPALLTAPLYAALFKLTKIEKGNLAEYSRWDKKALKPIRKLLDDGLSIWDYGFNVQHLSGTSKDYVDSDMHAELAQLVRTLEEYQYPWVQRSRAKKVVIKPTFKVARSGSGLSTSSFTSEGLNYETELMAIYLGDFEHARLERNSQGLSSIFNKYLKAYGKYCDAYLPSNKVAITYSKCATERVTKNGFGTVTNTSCVSWVNVPTGLYADPKLYSSNNKLSASAGKGMLKKAFSGDPFASRSIMDDTLSLGNDMSNLVQKNKCGNAGLKRFESNLYRFVEGKAPLLLSGRETLASTRNTKHTSFDAGNLNLAELIDDLIVENSKGWMMNRYQSGGVSNIRKGRNTAGSGSVTASYSFYSIQKRETGTVTLTFANDLPTCLYFFDAPQTCRKPSRRIINKYEKGQYFH
ncbi:MAG: hypothetical protein COB26_00100 [Piscirickettsiaceae bacterium]|nr:MAG: hypothetical protein COB26_00100 [Piscirickettsiaceae bacterium]